jgi:hypothetical protein
VFYRPALDNQQREPELRGVNIESHPASGAKLCPSLYRMPGLTVRLTCLGLSTTSGTNSRSKYMRPDPLDCDNHRAAHLTGVSQGSDTVAGMSHQRKPKTDVAAYGLLFRGQWYMSCQ